jgi:hypothetical protein
MNKSSNHILSLHRPTYNSSSDTNFPISYLWRMNSQLFWEPRYIATAQTTQKTQLSYCWWHHCIENTASSIVVWCHHIENRFLHCCVTSSYREHRFLHCCVLDRVYKAVAWQRLGQIHYNTVTSLLYTFYGVLSVPLTYHFTKLYNVVTHRITIWTHIAGSEALTAVAMESSVFWDMSCRLVNVAPPYSRLKSKQEMGMKQAASKALFSVQNIAFREHCNHFKCKIYVRVVF